MLKDDGATCKTYVDGIDFEIYNPPKRALNVDPQWPFDRKWYSHKFISSGVRYEVVTAIKTGYIVAVNGPFPCGSNPDVTIFRRRTKLMLQQHEMVEADKGYRGDSKIRTPDHYTCNSEKVAKRKVAARHETINGRLVFFRCLHHVFRHPLSDHKYFFSVAAVTTQAMFQMYGTTYDVHYSANALAVRLAVRKRRQDREAELRRHRNRNG